MKEELIIVLAVCVVVGVCREAVTVHVPGNVPLYDIKNSPLTTSYCVNEGKQCPQEDVMVISVGTLFQCTVRCSRRTDCFNVFYSNRKCHLRKERCQLNELTDAKGKNMHRLLKGEKCSKERPLYHPPKRSYSNSYCLWKGKTCAGTGYFVKPQKMSDVKGCLIKCSKIRSCSMVNFKHGQCQPLLGKPCADKDLTDDSATYNFLRLPLGVASCPANRGSFNSSPPNPTATKTGDKVDKGGDKGEKGGDKVDKGGDKGNKGGDKGNKVDKTGASPRDSKKCDGFQWIEDHELRPGAQQIIAGCPPGCKMTSCTCREWQKCDGARFGFFGDCIVRVKDRYKGSDFYARMTCVVGSFYDVIYISTVTGNLDLTCPPGYRRESCSFYAKHREALLPHHIRERRAHVGASCGIHRPCIKTGRCIATAACIKVLPP